MVATTTTTRNKPSTVAPNLVPVNAKGGVLVTERELETAFEFFDTDKSGKITVANLKKRLSVFYKNMPLKEYRFLMNNKPEMSLEDFKELLLENEVTDFDPIAEAFKVYDPERTGFIDSNILKSIFENLGFGDITDDGMSLFYKYHFFSDLAILIEAGDVDGDGKVSLQGKSEKCNITSP